MELIEVIKLSTQTNVSVALSNLYMHIGLMWKGRRKTWALD